jgi:hypothetical protein
MQLWDGTFQRIAECSEEMLAEIRHSHPNEF